jgi:energy-coupling factor transporter ATP-binding protein EcfA2
LVGERFREEVNEKVKAFAKKLASHVGVEIDHTYDTRRVTTVIGSLNLKIPDAPLQTRWDKEIFAKGFEYALKLADEARQRNRKLLEAILNEQIVRASVQSEGKQPPKFEELLAKDEKLKDLFNGDWEKFGYKSRSEAEEALVCKLVFYGFSDVEIKRIMEGSQIGKWHEKLESYKDLTIRKAREYVEQHKEEFEEKPSLWLGDYRFAVSDKDFMLYDRKGACVFTCKLRVLNSSTNKKKLKEITSASESQVEEKVAVFLERVKAMEERREEEEKERGKRVVRTAFVELPDGRLAEEAYDGESVFFLVYNPRDGKVEKLNEVETEDCVYRPIQSKEVEHGTVLLPSKVEEYGNDEQLIKDIVDFLNRWHEPPDVLSRVLDAYYAFLTYISDLLPQIPYRRYLAPWGRGKSTWLDALGCICYRPVFLAGSDTEKSLVRRMNTWCGTCVVDEADFSDSSLYSFIIKILNIGYDRRRGWYYRCDDDNPRKVVGYNVFGCKCLATRTKYKDVALESRCLTTIGRENINPLPLFRMEKFMREAQTLRNKLILWRFRNYHRVKGLVAELEKPDIAQKIYNGGEQISNRVKQVILPLWLVAGDKTRAQLANLALTFDSQLKAADSDYVLEVEAKEAASTMVENGSGEVNVVNVLNVLMQPPRQEQYYAIQLSELSREILKGRGFGEKEITVKEVTSLSKQLARVFETRLGFTVRVAKARKRVVLMPSEWLKKKETPGLLDLLQSEASSYKDVQKVHHVHPKSEKEAETQATLTQDTVERVFQALAEASKERGTATTQEVAVEAKLALDVVKNVLEALQKEGRVYSPYPEWWKLA